MKNIGFIDYRLNNWHADNYPALIKKYSNGEMIVTRAYGCPDAPTEGRLTNEQWAEKNGIELCATMDEVIEKSDCIVVLSPDNPEQHLRLCEKPLMSGKRVYVDKTFAPDKETAQQIFAIAEKYNTPCFSSSALHFADEYQALYAERANIETIRFTSYSSYEIYSIHMIEPMVRLMDENAVRVMAVGARPFPSVIVEFESGRIAQISNYMTGVDLSANVGFKDGSARSIAVTSPFFDNFIKGMVKFFEDGDAPVPHKQTIDVIAVRGAGLKALDQPFTWVNVW